MTVEIFQYINRGSAASDLRTFLGLASNFTSFHFLFDGAGT